MQRRRLTIRRTQANRDPVEQKSRLEIHILRQHAMTQFGLLADAAKTFEDETGYTPQRYTTAVEAGAGVQGRANALLADLEWFRVHTESIHQRLRRAVNKAI